MTQSPLELWPPVIADGRIVRPQSDDELDFLLVELDARLERLRERLRKGDPDMTADEIQVAIERAQSKRAELEAAQPGAKQSAKILPMLTKAAALYRRQIAQGLDGNEREALKCAGDSARAIRRENQSEAPRQRRAVGGICAQTRRTARRRLWW